MLFNIPVASVRVQHTGACGVIVWSCTQKFEWVAFSILIGKMDYPARTFLLVACLHCSFRGKGGSRSRGGLGARAPASTLVSVLLSVGVERVVRPPLLIKGGPRASSSLPCPLCHACCEGREEALQKAPSPGIPAVTSQGQG